MLGHRIKGFLHIPRAAVQGALLIPRRLQSVDELKVGSVRYPLR